MAAIKVELKARSYPIIVGRGILPCLGRRCAALSLGSDAFCVTNAAIRTRFGAVVERSLKEAGFGVRFGIIADSEKSKSFASCSKVLGKLARFDRQKRVFIVALGGGVAGDLGGFCAAVYKRGIPYVQVPTTLLAQVDSSIGGKTAIDLAEGKNLVGAFYQPRLVLSDTGLLASLDRRQFASGMAEAVKYGIIRDPRLFSLIERDAGSAVQGRAETLEKIVGACARIKAGIVSRDETEENGERIILNFGHTLGHAFEAASGYGAYTHGEAVSIGMACACDLSCGLGLLSPETARRIEQCLARLRLPVSAKAVAPRKVMEACLRDKKFKGKRRFVLLTEIGKTKVVEDVPLEMVIGIVKKRSAVR